MPDELFQLSIPGDGSFVLVMDLPRGRTFRQAIDDAITYATANGKTTIKVDLNGLSTQRTKLAWALDPPCSPIIKIGP